MTLSDILKDSPYQLTQFSTEQIQRLDDAITLKERLGNTAPYAECLVRKKAIQLKPEEAVNLFV